MVFSNIGHAVPYGTNFDWKILTNGYLENFDEFHNVNGYKCYYYYCWRD